MTNAKLVNQQKDLEVETSLCHNGESKPSVSLQVGQASNKRAMKDAVKERDRIVRFICIFLLVSLSFYCGFWVASKPPDTQKAVRVIIMERPQPPQEVSGQILDQQSVQLNWTAGHDGNVGIDSYLVEMRSVQEGNSTQVGRWKVAMANITAKETSVIVPIILDKATMLEFRMKAKNAVGSSDPSQVTQRPLLLGPQPPKLAPKELKPRAIAERGSALEWPASSELITGYRLRYRYSQPTHYTDWIDRYDLINRTQFYLDEVSLHGLECEFQVAAINNVGVGPYSQSIFVRVAENSDKYLGELSVWKTSPSQIVVLWIHSRPFMSDQVRLELVKDHRLVRTSHSSGLLSSFTFDGLTPGEEYQVSVYKGYFHDTLAAKVIVKMETS